MIRELRAAFYDTAENVKYKFIVILQISLCQLFERSILAFYRQVHQILHSICHLATPIKFMNEIIHSVIAQFTNQTLRIIEIMIVIINMVELIQ